MQKNRMELKKKQDMSTLCLEPNTCILHYTLPPGLLVKTSNVWMYRLHFRSPVERMGCRFGTVININHVLLQISRDIGVFA
jgi:hypothetical protein